MPPKIGAEVSPNGYAPVMYGRNFRTIAMPPNFREQFFLQIIYHPEIGGSFFKEKSKPPKYEDAVLTYILDSQMLILLCLQQVNK